jgi:hypothetical protein
MGSLALIYPKASTAELVWNSILTSLLWLQNIEVYDHRTSQNEKELDDSAQAVLKLVSKQTF